MTESTTPKKVFPDFPEKDKGKDSKDKAKDAAEICHCNALTVPHRHNSNSIDPVPEEES